MIRYAKLTETAKDPIRKHPTDAGIDLFADENVFVDSFSTAIIHTGITFEIPEGYCMQLWPKSRNNHLVGAGIVDTGYQGEILVKYVNYFPTRVIVEKGTAIAQAVLVKIDTPTLEQAESSELLHAKPTERGNTGGIVSQTA